jgi:oligopeptide transport system ATP-binding protein
VFRRIVGSVRAVDGIDLEIPAAQTFGLVGESGCGKSSLARALLRLQEPTSGSVQFTNRAGDRLDLTSMPQRKLRTFRNELQIVFQDPYSSLNPRLSVTRILDEPLRAMERLPAGARRKRIIETLALVGLSSADAERYPHQFSGGQRQRIAIARALLSHPNLVVLDEPVSALDVSIRAQVINLLIDLQRRLGLTYLFVSHDLSVVRYICDTVAVMYLGRIVEVGPTRAIFERPLHPYTKLLLAAVPQLKPRRARASVKLQGDPPSPLRIPEGCAFHSRCPLATDICRAASPALRDFEAGHRASCHHATLALEKTE